MGIRVWAYVACGVVTSIGCSQRRDTQESASGKTQWALGQQGGANEDITVARGQLAFGARVSGVAIAKNEQHLYTFFAVKGGKAQIALSADVTGLPDTFLQ